MGLQEVITQETKQQNNYLESESVLDDDFSITQPELAAVKIYVVDNFKSALRIQNWCLFRLCHKEQTKRILHCFLQFKTEGNRTVCPQLRGFWDIWTKLKK